MGSDAPRKKEYKLPVKSKRVEDFRPLLESLDARDELNEVFKNRIAKAVELLQLTKLPIESIAISCGYSDPMVFSKAFRQEKTVSPSAYRKEMQKGDARRNMDHLKQVEEFIEEKRTADTAEPETPDSPQ